MNEKYVIDKIKEIEEAGATPKEHTHTVSDISDMPSTFTPAAHNHAAGEITSGTLDAARIPALTSDKITDLDAKISDGISEAIGDADISSFDSRIKALEAGEFETVNAESVTAETFNGNLTGIITKSAELTDSAPYYTNNITVMTLPSFSLRGGSNVIETIGSLLSTVSLPWGTYTIDKPIIPITYTARYGDRNGSIKLTVKYNGDTVYTGSLNSSSGAATFTINVDTSQENTLQCSCASSSYSCTVSPDNGTLYLKYI